MEAIEAKQHRITERNTAPRWSKIFLFFVKNNALLSMRDRLCVFCILNGQEINRSLRCTPTRIDTRNVLTKSVIKRKAMNKKQITLQKCHYGYENNIIVYRPISTQRFAFLILFMCVRVNAKPSVLLFVQSA